MNPLSSLPRLLAPMLLAGCASALPDELHIASDTGGLLVPEGLCDDRNAGIGSAPVERVEVELDCEGPGEDGRVQSCAEVSLKLRFDDGGMSHLRGLADLKITVLLPNKKSGQASLTIVPLDEAGMLTDGLHPELKIDLPAVPSQRSLQAVAEDNPDACNHTQACAWMGINGVVRDDETYAQRYPLGTAASGVVLLDGIGWDDDPVILELEVPFFAPNSEEAMVCKDGLIHYERDR